MSLFESTNVKINHRLLITMLLITALLAPILPIGKISPAKADPDKIVYVATAAIDSEGPVDLYKNPPFPDPYNKVAEVFDPTFRSSHTDSFGTPFKMTWYDHMGAYIAYMSNGPSGPYWTYTYKDGTPTGVSGYLALYDILHNNWGTEMAIYGDEDAYHHHFMKYTGSGKYGGWVEYIYDGDPSYTYHMDTIDHMILDRGFFPTDWRPGWLDYSQAQSNWLDQWFPFDYMDPGWYGTNWWHPWHSTYYGTPTARWLTRCALCEGSTLPSQSDVNWAFSEANSNGASLFSWYCHAAEGEFYGPTTTDMAARIDMVHQYLVSASISTGISFKYVTAREAMQLMLGYTDRTAPAFTITQSGGTYTITSSESLWANHPYIALKYSGGTYTHPTATWVGTNTWTVTPTNPLSTEENVAVLARPGKIPVDAVYGYANTQAYMAIDGIENENNLWEGGPTWWDKNGDGQLEPDPRWLQLDLGSSKSIASIRIHFWDYITPVYQYQYYITVSDDNETWTQVTPSQWKGGVVLENFVPAIDARYVRIWVTDQNGPWNRNAHIVEATVNSASGATASAYSTGYEPELAIDGIEASDHSNYWQGSPLPAWLQIDLRAQVSISKITTHFYNGPYLPDRKYTYYIEASNDALSWSTIVSSKQGTGSVTDTFPEITTRYVRITVTANTANPAAHIEEIKIYHIASIESLQTIGVAANDQYGNPGTLVMNLQPGIVESCDSTGEEKDRFGMDDVVYVSGNGYGPSQTHNLYIVSHQDSWTNGEAIPTPVVPAITMHADTSGEIDPTIVWSSPLAPGKYDIVIDVNNNGKYDSTIDALDAVGVEGAGFFVIPEYALGTILAIGVCFAGVAIYKRSKRHKLKPF